MTSDSAIPAKAMVQGQKIEPAGAVELLDSAHTVTVLCHVNPDADTIGSGFALALALAGKGKSVQVSFASPTELPESLASLPGSQWLVAPSEVADKCDVLVSVDCASSGRLGSLLTKTQGATHVLVVDHHASNDGFGDFNLVDSQADSTTVMIARLLDSWDVEFTRDIAHCLFAGLVTDTGSFRWAGSEAYQIAHRLLETGIDSTAITRELLDTHPFGWLSMLGTVLRSAVLVEDAIAGRGLVYAIVRSEDSAGLRSEEIESVVDIVRTTSEAEVAAVFKEVAPLKWSVSMRAKSVVDVSRIALALGGGGHRLAAGYTALGTADEVVAALRHALG
ncbi:MAG: DHH family phosphoesterase [Mycobacteriaceae bacterium]